MNTRKFLKIFGKLERPIGWTMLFASIIAFFAVLFDFVKTGDFKLATLLISADLFISGFSAAQDAEDNAESVAAEVK